MGSRILFIAAGGTGGGIYPALTVVDALRKQAPDWQQYFIGSVGGMEEKIVPREKLDGYHAVRSGPIHGVNLFRKLMSGVAILGGMLQSWTLAGWLRPAALFLTGGWATFPIAVGCWLRRVPVAIYVPDIQPAMAIKIISRFARLIMTPTPDSAAYFPAATRARVKSIGYPLRQDILEATRPAAMAHFRLSPDRRTLLVWGGSRGARRINEALIPILPDLISDGWQVIHVSGELDWPTVQSKRDSLPESVKSHYHAFSYLRDDVGLALAAADLTVSRAGASVLGEYPHFGLPSILVPLTFAWGYQEVNAKWMTARGAAVSLDNESLDHDLLPTIRKLVSDPVQFDAMRKASAALAGGDVAGKIAEQVLTLAKNGVSG